MMTRLPCLAALALIAAPLRGQTREVEPNDSRATATHVELGAIAAGTLTKPDAQSMLNTDWWSFDAAAGDTLRFEWDETVVPSGNLYGIMEVRLYAGDGTFLIKPEPEPSLNYVIKRSGRYYLELSAAREYGDDYYEIGLWTNRHPKPPCEVAHDGEPNDSFDAARVITLGARVDGILCPSRDVDFFRFHAAARTRVQIRIDRDTGSKPSAWGNPDVEVVSPSRTVEHWKGDWSRGSVFEMWAPEDGDYYAWISTRGGVNVPYALTLQSPGSVPPGPGDPVSTLVANLGNALAFAVGPNGDFFVAEEDQSIWRVSRTGEARRWFSMPAYTYPLGIAVDAAGNLLVVSFSGLYRVSPAGVGTQLIANTVNSGEMGAIAVASDGTIWVALAFNKINQLDGEGRLLQSYDVSGANPTNPYGLQGLAFAPDGILYFAAGDGIYRLIAGKPELFVRDTSEADLPAGGGPSGNFAFDASGNLYVPHRFSGGISEYDRTGAEIAKPFAWISGEARALAFGRNPDGSGNSCLFVLTNTGFTTPASLPPPTASIVELNPSGVSAPGCPLATPAVTVDDAVHELLHPGRLSPQQLQLLDQQGNKNGRYDVGDLRAFLLANGGAPR